MERKIHILILALIGCVCLVGNLSAQSTKEEWRQKIQDEPNDTIKCYLYSEAADYFSGDDLDVSLEFSKEGLQYSQEKGILGGMAANEASISWTYDIFQKYDSAIVHIQKSKKIYEELQDSIAIADCMTYEGALYFFSLKLDRATEAYLESIEFLKLIDYPAGLSNVYVNLAIIYRQRGKYEDAIRIYEEAVELAADAKTYKSQANGWHNMGLVYMDMKKYEIAEECFLTAIHITDSVQDYQESLLTKIALGENELKIRDYEGARKTLLEALDSLPNYPNLKKYSIAYTQILMSDLNFSEGDFEEARKWAQLSLETAEKTEKSEAVIRALERVSELDRLSGDFEQAYLGQRKISKTKDLIMKQENEKYVHELLEEYESEKKDVELRLQAIQLEQEQKDKRTLLYLLAGIGLLGIVVLYFLYERVKTGKQLEKQNLLIEKSLKEKSLLLKEIHHRVKNNLQVISSLLSIQSRHITDEKALAAVTESQQRVRSMALIHQNLYQEDDLTGINMGDYITRLSKNLFSSYKVSESRIKLETAVENLRLDIDTTIPIGLILNELISNALKYAFPEGREGILKVAMKIENEILYLIVEDDGVGIPETKDLTKEASFGMKMVKTLSMKLKANMDVESKNGTKVILSINKYVVR